MQAKRVSVNLGFAKELEYLQFPGLSNYKRLAHAVFTRHGGVSKPPYAFLNTSYSTGDDSEAIDTNLEIIKRAIGVNLLLFMNQNHGREILVLKKGVTQDVTPLVSADAAITDIPHLPIMIKQADCQAVILFDPIGRVVANVHCGWRGNTQNLLGSVVSAMERHFGSQASDLRAAVGPSLGPCCAEFKDHENMFPKRFKMFMMRKNYFNLWEISRWQLLEAGLRSDNIEVAGICTRCRTDLFFSYRGEGVTGRSGTVAMLRS